MDKVPKQASPDGGRLLLADQVLTPCRYQLLVLSVVLTSASTNGYSEHCWNI